MRLARTDAGFATTMRRNVEIKARARDWARQMATAQGLCPPPEMLTQNDTFFACAHGYLKLREFGDGTGELIAYTRADACGPKVSQFTLVPTDTPEELRQALTRSLGVTQHVRKRRAVYLLDNTRIHFDEVEGLGRFLELEVMLKEEQSAEDGERIAESLMSQLDIRAEDLVAGPYAELLS